jgi:hypothetical protein
MMRDACVLMVELDDPDAILDDLLSRWHHWQKAARVGRGHNDRALVFGELYRPSRQYDDWNGALDTDLEARRSAQVDFEVSEMIEPWKTAIYCLARNLYTGRTVWSSPRLPEDHVARANIVVRARVILTGRLMNAGVM